MVLNLNKVVSRLMSFKSFELFTHYFTNVVWNREKLLDCSNSIISFFKLLRYVTNVQNTSLRQLGKQVEISQHFVSRVFNFLNSFCLLYQQLNIWWLYHKINLIACWTLKLNRTWWLIRIKNCPFFSNSFISFKHSTFQIYKSLANNRFVFTMSPFDAHHVR